MEKNPRAKKKFATVCKYYHQVEVFRNAGRQFDAHLSASQKALDKSKQTLLKRLGLSDIQYIMGCLDEILEKTRLDVCQRAIQQECQSELNLLLRFPAQRDVDQTKRIKVIIETVTQKIVDKLIEKYFQKKAIDVGLKGILGTPNPTAKGPSVVPSRQTVPDEYYCVKRCKNRC